MIVQPDRLAILYCPGHKGGEHLVITNGDEVLKYHVVRMIWKLNGEVYDYCNPPVMFVIAALEHYQANNPNQTLGMAESKCAACRGFDDPGFNRLRRRRKK